MMNIANFNIETALKDFAESVGPSSHGRGRSAFHNEADFQFEFGRFLETIYGFKIRFEYFCYDEKSFMAYDGQSGNEKKAAGGKLKKDYIDLVAFSPKEKACLLFELKYKIKAVLDKNKKPKISDDGETYFLFSQGNADHAVYSVIADLHRMEQIQLANSVLPNSGWKISGYYSILLSNDKTYWKKDHKGLGKNFFPNRMDGNTFKGRVDIPTKLRGGYLDHSLLALTFSREYVAKRIDPTDFLKDLPFAIYLGWHE
jgi:hypothetical protein